MNSVWKFQLVIQDEQRIDLPLGSKFLTVMAQRDMPVLYALVDLDTDTIETWTIEIRGTGHPSEEKPSLYLGSVSTHNELYVWHIWRREE